MDFFEQANSHVSDLNANERKIFKHVVRNIEWVQDLQIRALAAECSVSTTTIMRFTKKLGFSGYREFIDALRLANHAAAQSELPSVLKRQSYEEAYLKNVVESVRMVSEDKIEVIRAALSTDPRIYCYGTGLDAEVARYAYHLLADLGYRAVCPMEAFERQLALKRMDDGDVLFLFSLTGEDPETLDFVERAQLSCTPAIVTVTQSAGNTLQSLSTTYLYVLADAITVDGANVSSRASMIAIVELLAHSLIKNREPLLS